VATIDSTVLSNARAACADALVRHASGDNSVTDSERDAYKAVLAALKTGGVGNPFSEVLDRAVSLPNFRTS
jgi:predicted GTPase